MSTYNDSKYIGEAIESVLKQTFSNWEFIIIDDVSTDNTEKIIKSFSRKDKRFKVIKNKSNKGFAVNLNTGVRISKAKFIARLDSDDVWIDKNKLKKQIVFMNSNPDFGLVGSWAIAIDKKGKKLFTIKYPSLDDEIRRRMLFENCFVHSSVLFSKKVVLKLGNYDPKQAYEDYQLWLKVGTVLKFYNIPEFLVYFRYRQGSKSVSNYKNEISSALSMIDGFRHNYPNYAKGKMIWQIRKLYPLWFRMYFVNQIKERFRIF